MSATTRPAIPLGPTSPVQPSAQGGTPALPADPLPATTRDTGTGGEQKRQPPGALRFFSAPELAGRDAELGREAFAAALLEAIGAHHQNARDGVDRLRLGDLHAQLTALNAPARRRDLGLDELDELRVRLRGLLTAAATYALISARVAAAGRGEGARG